MTLGGITLPRNTKITPTIYNVESERQTLGGKLKSDILDQKTNFSLQVPAIFATYFDSLKQLKEAKTSTTFVYDNESGSGEISKTVKIGDMTYDYIGHTSSKIVQNLTLILKEV